MLACGELAISVTTSTASVPKHFGRSGPNGAASISVNAITSAAHQYRWLLVIVILARMAKLC